MSFVLIAPEFVTAAAGDLTNLGSSISAANASAASATTQVLAAGADEVSARIAALFGGFGLEYQAISAQVAAYHQRFVQALSTGAGAYASAEAAAAEQIVLGVINAPTQALLGRPLIGDGANATTNRCHRRRERGRRQRQRWQRRHRRYRRQRRHRRRRRRCRAGRRRVRLTGDHRSQHGP
ncbi:PE PGRS family protein [Mycobacterium tuberculosis]|nr:PE PGRS family protein [Mycobacterium tuberculosis]